MLLGDIHGSLNFFRNRVLPAAVENNVRWIYQVGDFGYWEHTPAGVDFLDELSHSIVGTGIELVFIPGNHDKTSLIPTKYNMIDGFYHIRPGVWFAPNGTHWKVNGKGFLVLGGAYSIDKNYRLDAEQKAADKIVASRSGKSYEYSIEFIREQAYTETAQTLWFPEEEMTFEEFQHIFNTVDPAEVDIILAHDKPYMSNPGIKLSPIPDCIPNQRRLQAAVNLFQPELFVHGHLHVRYKDTIRCGDDNKYTVVEGLGADVPNFSQYASDWRANDAWEILSL